MPRCRSQSLGSQPWLALPLAKGGWGASAIVHLGKHGTLEWLPGKALALSDACYPDLALGLPKLVMG